MNRRRLHRVRLVRLRRVVYRFADFTARLLFGIFTAPFVECEYIPRSRRPFHKCQTCPLVHNGFHRCPNRLVGFCLDCGRRRLLDGYARCPSGHSSVGEIGFRWTRQRGGGCNPDERR